MTMCPCNQVQVHASISKIILFFEISEKGKNLDRLACTLMQGNTVHNTNYPKPKKRNSVFAVTWVTN